MTVTFNNQKLVLTTTQALAYQVPSGKSAVITMIQVVNKSSNPDYATVYWVDSRDSVPTNLVYNVSVPPGGVLGCLTGKLPLKAGDQIRGLGTWFQYLEMTIGIIEIG